ncbi:MAG: hypothetical protein ACFFD1_11900, partial [Candidatus Thorarchaeota archaeon]
MYFNNFKENDSFIEPNFLELWVIKESICIFHKSWIDNSINTEPQLLAGFVSALISFSSSEKTELRNIDFENSR